MNTFLIIAGFVIIALASRQIGQFFTKAHFPLITGFLFTGIIAGPFILGLIPGEAIKKLHFIDQLSLAFIAFAAGSELYLKELRSRLKSIKWVTAGLVMATFTIGSMTVFMLSEFIPFMRDMPTVGRIAVSILGGAILVARSPSSAIAIVNELRAKGPFTLTVLGVTVVMDIVVIVLFAFNTSIADALLTGRKFSPDFIALVSAELLLSLALGYALWKILRFILSRHIKSVIKAGMILLTGYSVFLLSAEIRRIGHSLLPFEIFLEPLLICMVGSFLVTNYSNYRDEFRKILYDIGPPIYILFFTLTGASLALDVLAGTWLIAMALFFVRIAAIFIGSFVGGILAGDPMQHNRLGWMAYITQAGIGLGLAKQMASEFPDWGADFATVIIAVIVLNQIIGPVFFKWAINLAGEAHSRAETPEFDGVRDAIIFGLERESIMLARQLRSHGWQVKIASIKAHHIKENLNTEFKICPISSPTLDVLHQLDAGKADAIVALLSDEENYQLCEIVYEHFGTKNLVVRLNDRGNFHRFQKLGALVVEPATAFVSLLDHFVRSPSATSLLLGMTENQDVIDFEIGNPDLHGVSIRDLRLPLDTIILSVRRGEHMMISHGYTRLEVGDWVTIVGSLESLEKVMLQFDNPYGGQGSEL